MTRRASDLLVDCLLAHGVDRLFCVPGESYLAVLDALYERNTIETVVARHEGGAGFMAVADAKLTGRAGVAFCSRGPGATNASIAVHVAEQDAVPLVLFIGQVPRHELGRGAFQEVDYSKMFAGMAKWVWQIENADRLPEVVARAFAIASAPTPGPVVIVLPEDMLEDMTEADVVQPLSRPVAMPPSDDEMFEIVKMISKAERPLLIAGGRVDTEQGRRALVSAAEAHGLPVLATFKRQHMFPNGHPLYAGHLGFKIPRRYVDLYAQSDLVIAVGTRLGEVSTQGYTFPNAPVPRQPLVHVFDDPIHIGRVFQATRPMVADPVAFLEAVDDNPTVVSEARIGWSKRLNELVSGARAWTPPKDGLLDMGPVAMALVEQAANDAIFITDAGNFSGWLHKHYPFNGNQPMLGSVGGAMGMGMPAAIAAGLRHPGRQVITWIGDGGMGMSGAELATAMQYDVPVKVFVSNNGSYGTIRMHQEKSFKSRVSGTRLTNPDYAKWAESHGAKGMTIRSMEAASAVVAAALKEPGPVVVDVHTNVEHVSPGATIADLRS